MKFILTVIFSFVFLVSGFSQTRNVVVGTNDVIVQPTNFWSANASNGRTGLGLGSAATNPASAFQPSSSVLSNLISSNLTIIYGGTGATNAAGARTNLGLGWSALTNTNASTSLLGFTTNGQVVANTGTNVLTFTTGGGGMVINGDGSIFTINGNGISFETGAGSILYMPADDVVQLGGPWNDITVRASLGFSTNLNTLWTATNASNARSAVGLGNTNSVQFGTTILSSLKFTNSNIQLNGNSNNIAIDFSYLGTRLFTAGLDGISFGSTYLSAATRANLGLGWSALTNTNTSGFNASLYGSNTNPVLVNSNGSVVSPTNFWEVAPIQTLVQDFTGVTVSQTNNATNARNVYIYSLATNVSGISNTIILPTNTSTFNGDEVCVIHKGTTNTTTVVRQAGSTNNFITLNRFDESVKFIRELGQWDFYHNISFVEPIQFSGTNAAANVAASRTNLGLGWSALTNTNSSTSLLGFTTNGTVVANTGTNVLTFTNDVQFRNGDVGTYYSGFFGFGVKLNLEERRIEDENIGSDIITWASGHTLEFGLPVSFLNTTNAATTRTNLGLGLPALTNTNAAGFQRAIFTTNAAPTNSANVNTVNFNTAVAWMEVSIVTNNVTNSYRIPLFQ